MKRMSNAQCRFTLAKKVDVYIKRAQFLQIHIQNKDTNVSHNPLPCTPKAPQIV